MKSLRRGLLLGVAAVSLLLACDPGTRIEGSITLGAGKQAPDSSLHTLYVAAFPSAAITTAGGVVALHCSAATANWVEFGDVSNADFNPEVTYALGGAGGAKESWVFAWWKVTVGLNPDFACPGPSDLFGAYSNNPVFFGQSGTGSGGQARQVDLVLNTAL
jgi:hypothetical protein